MKFIKLTDEHNRSRYINPTAIAYIEDEKDCSSIWLKDGRVYFYMKSSAEELVKNIESQLKPANKDLPS